MKSTTLVIAAAALALAGCRQAALTESSYIAEAKKTVREIAPADAAAEMKANPDVFLLDVSMWNEYERGHIAGAVIIPRGMLEFRIARNDLFPTVNRGRVPRNDQPIIVYCQFGGRSVLAARTLMEMGYTNVRSLKGGLDAWKQAKLPLEKSPTTGPVAPTTMP